MYKYETHLHTSPASKCARASVKESLELYKSLGFEGVFVTNHFPNVSSTEENPTLWEEKMNAFFADYEEAKRLEKEMGISVFLGAEWSYQGSDFLVYGLDKAWYLAHPDLSGIKFSERLQLAIDEGALVIQVKI